MSRFNAKVVNETWEIERTESGRKRAKGKDGDRTVFVWVSDIKNEDGIYPVMGRYLLPLPDVSLVDDKIDEIRTLWVTRSQYRTIMNKAKIPIRKAGFEDMVHGMAKLMDKVLDKIHKTIGPDKMLSNIIDGIMNSTMEKVMNVDFIEKMLGSLSDKLE